MPTEVIQYAAALTSRCARRHGSNLWRSKGSRDSRQRLPDISVSVIAEAIVRFVSENIGDKNVLAYFVSMHHRFREIAYCTVH